MTTTTPPGVRPSRRPPHRPRHRLLTLLVVVLLIAVPLGYLVRSAFQSRESGEDKQRNAAATNLTYGWPNKVQRDVYDVPLPSRSSHYAFYEANSWQTSTLYVQFRLPPKKLGEFLEDVGTSSSALRSGHVTIGGRHAEKVGWDLEKEGHDYAGTTYRQSGNRPDVAITVDRTYRSMPRVYVVSTVKF
ncbi:hypothetical protein [Streptomyces sp. WMMB 322]|uniref:hypothetical protein n=1 Tax=Streptomyces sp. WMMB 322 TaxID=1286821 RepID=UPI0006E19550|nr:hypothetical protein [Streptomyces sp. WMMB 322]SCK42226.1 hypothetical protein H180DRAFT_03667 [Streptomyces sp. WMMB 322]